MCGFKHGQRKYDRRIFCTGPGETTARFELFFKLIMNSLKGQSSEILIPFFDIYYIY